VSDQLDAEFLRFIDSYIHLSTGMRFEEKRRLWDSEEPCPVLIPEEADQPLVGWPAIEGYWQNTRHTLQSLTTEWWDLTVQRLSDDEVLLLFKQRWCAEMQASAYFSTRPLASTVRVTMGARRRADGWRIFMSTESHLDGVEYFRALYGQRALAGD
jgi:hypothetical protein